MVLRRPLCKKCYRSKDDYYIDAFLCRRPCTHSCHDGQVALGTILLKEKAAAA
jgi:hypothetical protein